MFREPELSINLGFVNELRPIAESAEKTVAHLAIAWILRRPEITGAIVGARRPEQFEETVQAAGWILGVPQLEEIHRLLEERRDRLRNL